jgi:hypothetical protein
MALIVLEALGALAILLLIVWWTMFSGRDKGELRQPPGEAANGREKPENEHQNSP